MFAKYTAQTIIIALDFDGCIGIGEAAKIKYAKVYQNATISPSQSTVETYPLGKEMYKQLMEKVTVDHIMEYQLDPHCKEVLAALYAQGFRFALVSSRTDNEMNAAKFFIKMHKLPIEYFHSANNQSKAAICTRLKARAFLDDSLFKLLDLTDTPMHLFFLRREWNRHEQPSAKGLVTTVSNWQEFELKLLEMKELHEAVCFYKGWENNSSEVKNIHDIIKNDPRYATRALEEFRKRKEF